MLEVWVRNLSFAWVPFIAVCFSALRARGKHHDSKGQKWSVMHWTETETEGNMERQGETEKEVESDRWPEGGWCGCMGRLSSCWTQKSISFVTLHPSYDLILSLSLSFLISLHLSFALNHSILISHHYILFIIADSYWLSLKHRQTSNIYYLLYTVEFEVLSDVCHQIYLFILHWNRAWCDIKTIKNTFISILRPICIP